MQTTVFILSEKWQQRFAAAGNFLFLMGILATLGLVLSAMYLLARLVVALGDAIWSIIAPITQLYQHSDNLMRAAMLVLFCGFLTLASYIILPKLYRIAQGVSPAVRAWL